MLLRILTILILVIFALPAFAAEDKLPLSLEELNAELIAKKAELEPFNEDDIKVDLESLGLDDLSKKDPKKVDKKADKKSEKAKGDDKEMLPPFAIPSKDSQIEAISKDVDNKSAKKEGLISKVQNFLHRSDKNSEENYKDTDKKGANKKLNDKTKTKSKEETVADQIKQKAEEDKKLKEVEAQKEIKKQRKLNDEKRQNNLKKLQDLRETYLIKIKDPEEKDDYLNSTKTRRIPLPRKKNINPFISEDLPALPILDRVRGSDNLHIPLIPNIPERVNMLFETIAIADVAFFNSVYKNVRNANVRNKPGDTLLTYAILMQQHDIIASILRKGANPDLRNNLGYSPLDIAIELLDLETVELLIENKVDVKSLDGFGRTHLMHAARVGFLPAVKLFMKNGVDVNIMDDDGFTALSIAYRNKRELIVQLLLKNGAKTWIEKPYNPAKYSIIRELENHWK